MKPSFIGRNFSAQIYNQAVTFSVQLGLIPILISSWGLERYGVWLILSAVPIFLSVSDFGLTFTVKNALLMHTARANFASAVEVFRNCLLMLFIIIGCLFILSIFVIMALPLGELIDLGSETESDAKLTFGFLLASVYLYQFQQLFNAGIRAARRAETEVAITATFRLLEAGAWAGCALSGGGLLAAATAGLLIRLVAVIITLRVCRILSPWVSLGFWHANFLAAISLMPPAINYMMLPLSNALLVHAPLFILGTFANAELVALYGVTRTVSRFGMSVANVVNFSFLPEYSYSYGLQETRRFWYLFKQHGGFIFCGTCLYTIAYFAYAPSAISFLARGTLTSDIKLTTLMLGTVLFEVLWSFLFTPISAANLHKRMAYFFVAASVLSISIATQLQNVYFLASAAMFAHLVMLVVTAIYFSYFTRNFRSSPS